MACKFAREVGLVRKPAGKADLCQAVRALQQPLRCGAGPCLGDDAAAAQAVGCQGALQAAGRLARVPGEGGHGVGGGGVVQHVSGEVLRQRGPGEGVAQIQSDSLCCCEVLSMRGGQRFLCPGWVAGAS